jgi:hypothetical protein
MIQERHPDIEFDWPQLLKGRPEAPPPDRARPETASRGDRPGRPADRSERPERRGKAEGGRRSDRRPEPPPPSGSRPRVPVNAAASTPPNPQPAAPESGPAAARLGAAGLDRLRARYHEVVARIAQRVEDEARREELNRLAERLNPDDWTSDAAVSAGLEAYEATYDAVKSGIGGRRKPTTEADEPERPAAASEDEAPTDPEPR